MEEILYQMIGYLEGFSSIPGMWTLSKLVVHQMTIQRIPPKGSVIDDVWPDFPYNSPPFAILGRVFGRDNLTPTVITWGFVSQNKIMV